MEDSTGSVQPTKLYALLLKLRPLERGTIMPFSGELVHGAWLNWLRETAPEVAQQLHEGNKRRPFTCSSLQFPYAQERILQAQRDNIHLPLDPEKTYTVRLTLLQGELFPLLYTMIMAKDEPSALASPRPLIQIGKQSFLLEEVISHTNDPSGWADFTTCEDLVEAAKKKHLLSEQPLKMEFASITTFNRVRNSVRLRGNHYARLPLPSYVFGGLAVRWQEIVPLALKHVVQPERLQAFIEAEGVVIDDYQLQTHNAHFAQHIQPGFVGSCRYLLRGPDDRLTVEETLTLRQQIVLLSWFAFFTGVGYKPTMGMGQTRPVQA